MCVFLWCRWSSWSGADDNTSYSGLWDTISVQMQLKGGIGKIFEWFTKNFLKGMADKCHLVTSSEHQGKSKYQISL